MLALRNVSVKRGGRLILKNVSFTVAKQARVGLVGDNGVGKSTLLDCIAGRLRVSGGHILFAGDQRLELRSPWRIARMGISRSFQRPQLVKDMTVESNLILARLHDRLSTRFRVKSMLSKSRRNQVRDEVNVLLKRYDLEVWRDQLAGSLSFGQQKLISLLTALTREADFYLLDEPFSGISPKMLRLTQDLILDNCSTGLIVDHRLDALVHIVSDVMIIRDGSIHRDSEEAGSA